MTTELNRESVTLQEGPCKGQTVREGDYIVASDGMVQTELPLLVDSFYEGCPSVICDGPDVYGAGWVSHAYVAEVIPMEPVMSYAEATELNRESITPNNTGIGYDGSSPDEPGIYAALTKGDPEPFAAMWDGANWLHWNTMFDPNEWDLIAFCNTVVVKWWHICEPTQPVMSYAEAVEHLESAGYCSDLETTLLLLVDYLTRGRNIPPPKDLRAIASVIEESCP